MDDIVRVEITGSDKSDALMAGSTTYSTIYERADPE
jgi:hypothetical protein